MGSISLKHRFFCLAAALWLCPSSARTEEAPEAAAEPAALVRPKWLDKAQEAYGEALKAEEAGDVRTARRRLSKALKTLADGPDDAALMELKEEIAALLARVEEDLAPPPPPEEPPPPAVTLQPTAEELSEAPPAPPPPPAVEEKKRGYALPIDAEDPRVKKYISLYTTNPRYRANLQAAFNRMTLYRTMILKEIEAQGLPRELVYLPLVESEYQTRAVSRAGAVGLWQFMSLTGRNLGLNVNYWIDERLDPQKATKAALRHLKDLHDWFKTWPLALAAYNRGIYGLQRDLASTRSPDFSSVAGRGALPEETELYVPKFMAVTLIGDNAEAYGFKVPPAQIAPAADDIQLPKPLDIKVAAACAGTDEDQIRALNPSLRLWCTPKNEESFTLKIPKGARKKMQECLDNTKDWTPGADVVKHRVKRGDTIGHIAARYKTTTKAVMADNRMSNPKRLRVGQVLRIRPGKKYKGE